MQAGNYDFHDQAIAAFSLQDGNIHLVIDCFDDENEVYNPVTLLFTGVQDMTIDGVTDVAVAMLSDDGEMVHFELQHNKAFFLIEWVDTHNRKRETKSYRFSYRSEKITDDKRRRHS
jgi:hypothetical protein